MFECNQHKYPAQIKTHIQYNFHGRGVGGGVDFFPIQLIQSLYLQNTSFINVNFYIRFIESEAFPHGKDYNTGYITSTSSYKTGLFWINASVVDILFVVLYLNT